MSIAKRLLASRTTPIGAQTPGRICLAIEIDRSTSIVKGKTLTQSELSAPEIRQLSVSAMRGRRPERTRLETLTGNPGRRAWRAWRARHLGVNVAMRN
jgi:hypothetical protein